MEVDIEREHRVERKKKPEAAKKSGQPRTIVCRLKNWKQKEAVVRKAMKEKPVGLFICEDLSVATLEKRANQVEKLKAAKKAGKTAYFILDSLIIRDKPQVYLMIRDKISKPYLLSSHVYVNCRFSI